MAAFPFVIDLTTLSAADGFIIQGDAAFDYAGRSVSSAGDINGDGFADMIVGAPFSNNGGNDAGEAYVVFGKASGFANIDLTTLSAADGFIIKGNNAYDNAGYSVSSAGDINGDGFADIIVGAPTDDNGYVARAGAAYVIFGKASGFANIDLTTLTAADGFIIQGDAAFDRAGYSVSSAGDINGDGFADMIVGAPAADNGGPVAGEAYVIFGKAPGFANIDLTTLSAADGFIIQGDASGDFAGVSVSSAGDINGDGFADMIVGAAFGDNGGNDAGEAYVVFGKASGFANIDLTTLTAADGFIIQGDAAGDQAGRSVSSAGDINGDGFADMIVGAPSGDNGGPDAGEAYVIFGKASGFANIDLTTLTAADGFIIRGDAAGDHAGRSVSSAGDINGDGFADMIVGADAGEAYVIFGKASGFANIDLTTLSAADGFIIQGASGRDLAGRSVSSAGDINGDGFADLIVGAPFGDNGGPYAGEAYVIYGRATPPTARDDAFVTDEATVINGASSVFADNGSGADFDLGDNPFFVTEVNGNAGDVGTPIALPSGALLTLNADGTFTYDPNGVFDALPAATSGAPDVQDTDSFTYTITGGDTATATITIAGLDSDDVLVGTEAADTMNAGIGTDILHGNGGDDILEGGSGADDVDGGAGNDTARFTTAGSGVVANLNTGLGSQGNANGDTYTSIESLTGSDFDDTLVGDAGNNVLSGGNGADTLTGREGNDTLEGGIGADKIFGSAGIDTARFTTAGSGVIANLDIGLGSQGNANGDTYTSIENLTGSAFSDTLIGNGGDNVLHDGGRGAADTLRGLGGDDTYRVFNTGDVIEDTAGNGANDRVMAAVDYVLGSGVAVEFFTTNGTTGTADLSLTGNELAQTIFGNAGVNVISDGGGAADRLRGYNGSDTYIVRNAATVVEERAGQGTNDRVAASVDYTLAQHEQVEQLTTTSSGGTSAIDLRGNELSQTIIGNAGDNILHTGGGAADVLRGLGGDDTYRVFNTGDMVEETAGNGANDRVTASVDYALGSGVDVELLTTNGSSGTSSIDLSGNELAQEITGNAGDNRLEGREGSDTLRGLGGKDTFVFNTALGASNVDTIVDFNVADDRFLLSDAIFTKLNTGVMLSGYFRANTTGLAQDSNDHIIYETDTGKLFYDADGLGGSAGIQFAKLAVGLALTNADFSVA